ncbi:hypothetical protein QMU91_002485 [Flavobacterium psychrophilum]|nr:hypothetical protein [Flavobacterium psychrophilum]
MKYIILDGYLNGTGIRDGAEGGYIELEILNLSSILTKRIRDWIFKYENEFYNGYSDEKKVEELDNEGQELVFLLKKELLNTKIEYYSDAKMLKIIV